MAAQDELFQLIKSLTPSEKRYFKVNASKGGDAKSNYMQLFEAIDAQKEEYDEQKLKKKHAKKAFVKYLSAEKKQLREHIMKWMRAYRADTTIDNKINDLLQDEFFYRDKGLKTQREKSIQRAKELALKYERFHLLQEILERELMFVEEFEEKSLTEPVLRLVTELKQLSLNQQTFLELWTKNKEIFTALRSNEDPKDPVFKHRIEANLAEVEHLFTRIGDSYRLNRAFFRAHANFHNVFKNRNDAYEYTLKEYQLFQEKPHFKEEEAFYYKVCLANLISRAQVAGKTDEFIKYIEELKKLPQTTFNEEGEVFQNVYFLEHLHYINTGEFDKAVALVPEIEAGLTKYSEKINVARLITFQFNIMVMYFLIHNFKESLKWAEEVLSHKGDIKRSASTVTRILLPIIHFELGHYELVENLTRSAYRHLKTQNRLHSFEKLMVSYLNSMPFSNNSVEFKEKLCVFAHDLSELYNNPQESITFGMEEMRLWAESHVQNRKMSEIICD